MADEIDDVDDINLSIIALTALGLVGILAIAILLAWLAWQRWQTPGPNVAPALDVARPRLESSPQANLAQYRAQQAAKLQHWGWADGEPGVAQVPLDVAMQILVQRDATRRRAP